MTYYLIKTIYLVSINVKKDSKKHDCIESQMNQIGRNKYYYFVLYLVIKIFNWL